jgi:hypothetical protein
MGQYILTGSVPASGSAGSTSGTTTTSGAPEITVKLGTSLVSDGGTVSFGTTYVGTSVTRTITIVNQGTRALSLSRLGSVPAGFSIVSNVGLTSLSPGQSTSLTIRMNAAAAGTFGGRIVISNNDSNEGQYDLNLSGTVRARISTTTSTTTTTTSSTKRILDNGQAGYTTSGAWSTRTGSGRDGDMQLAGRNTGSNGAAARWNFSSLPAGSYRVWMTWTGGSGTATNAPISFYDGSRLVRTVTVDQRSAASGLSADGSNWKLITTLSISGSQLVVQLANNANGTVVADALRIERVAAAALPGDNDGDAAASELAIAALDVRHAAREDRTEDRADSPAPQPAGSELDAALMDILLAQQNGTSDREWDDAILDDHAPHEDEEWLEQPRLDEPCVMTLKSI